LLVLFRPSSICEPIEYERRPEIPNPERCMTPLRRLTVRERESEAPTDEIEETSPASAMGRNLSMAASAIPIGPPIELPEDGDAVEGRVADELNEFRFT